MEQSSFSFTNNTNIILLWDVLLDELNINKSNHTLISNIKTIFESNIQLFSSKINPSMRIIDLNKQFLSQVVLAVNKLIPNFLQHNNNNIQRLTITDEEVFEPYKIEDIHATRQHIFEKEVEQKRMEMEQYMTPHKPTELDFSDKNTDLKIKSMDTLIADKLKQRTLEIEQYNNDAVDKKEKEKEKWLTPYDTNIKNEKISNQYPKSIIKHKDDVHKKVSWLEPSTNTSRSVNIFDKLKKTNVQAQSQSQSQSQSQDINIKQEQLQEQLYENNNDKNDNEKSYVPQQSITLPDVIREEIIRTSQPIALNNIPIVPKSEMITQLNEMNTKIEAINTKINDMNTKIDAIYEYLCVKKTEQVIKQEPELPENNIHTMSPTLFIIA